MRVSQHPQDDLLIVEALVRFGHELEEVEELERSARAWELAADLAAEHELTLEDAIMQARSL